MESILNVCIAKSVRQFGGTLALDRWTFVSSHHLFNAMLVSTEGEAFLRSVKFITKRQTCALFVYWKHEANLSLLMPGQRRFSSQYIMLLRLLKVREALEQSVLDLEWRNYKTNKSQSA